MGAISHTQFLVWHEWLRRQWNKPNRTDHYLMQIDKDMINLAAKHPTSMSERKIKWTFGPVEEDKSKAAAKQRAELFEMHVMACAGVVPNG